MPENIKWFSLNRELFPCPEASVADRLICGHLNRAKFMPSIPTYLQNRKENLSKSKSLARASRCLCSDVHRLTPAQRKIRGIYEELKEKRKLAENLEKIAIDVSDLDTGLRNRDWGEGKKSQKEIEVKNMSIKQVLHTAKSLNNFFQ